jgi:hypothetical protein
MANKFFRTRREGDSFDRFAVNEVMAASDMSEMEKELVRAWAFAGSNKSLKTLARECGLSPNDGASIQAKFRSLDPEIYAMISPKGRRMAGAWALAEAEAERDRATHSRQG